MSIAVHVTLVMTGMGVGRFPELEPVSPLVLAGSEISIDTTAALGLPRVSPAATVYAEPEILPPLSPGGESGPARPDSGRRGRGGAAYVLAPAENLADRDDGILLSQEVASRIDRNQAQRVRTGASRSSEEDRRSLLDPMDLVFLADGPGNARERRPLAQDDPSRGARSSPSTESVGVALPLRPDRDALAQGAIGPRGGRWPAPGLGLLHGLPGEDHHLSAKTAHGRPMVARASPSVPSVRVGPSTDSVDSQQEVASALQSIVHASTAGGTPGVGPGGEEGPGASGAGGPSGAGSHAAPAGGGTGPYPTYDELDPRISAYRRAVLAKVRPLWKDAFPKWAILEGLQGRAIIGFVILADGRVDRVTVARPSGVPEFDANVRRAVLRAAPFAPPPLQADETAMSWSITFDAMNPVVR